MNNKKLKIIFFGTPNFVVSVLQTLNERFQVVAVVTAPDKKVGKKQLLTPSPIAEYAKKLGIPVFKPEKLDQDFFYNLQPTTYNLAVVAAYGKIIPQNILDIPKFGALNIHPSLLPKYRGPSPIQAALLNGDKVSGVTILVVDAEMDHGPIVATKEISLSNTDTFESLSKKMFEEGAKLLVKVIPDYIAGKIKPKEQNHQKATFTKMITKEDGYFNINDPAELASLLQIPPTTNYLPASKAGQLPATKLNRMIRAYYPWPGVWTKWSPSHTPQTSSDVRKMKIVRFLPKELVHSNQIGVQMEGKKPVKLEDFLRGYPSFPMAKI